MKKLLLLMFTFLVCLGISAQKTYFTCDFNDGIPDDFKLYDLDENKPIADIRDLGFKVGTPWIVMKVLAEEGNLSALSTSAYSPAGTSNDWMVTPGIKIESPDACFTWYAGVLDERACDGYKILVSTKGQKVEDFDDAETIYTISAEPATGGLNPHCVSLKNYVGKTVYIAFVNNSKDKFLLAVDDFTVEDVYREIDFVNLTQNVITQDVETRMKCALVNGFLPFELDATFTLKVGENTYTKTFTPLKLGSYEAKEIIFDEKIPAPAVDGSTNYDLTLTYEEGGETHTEVIKAAICRMGESSYKRRVVAEEATGTWCGYCPRGMVGMEIMHEKYPEDFIGIAVHNDIMQVDEYMNNIGAFIEGFPSAVINRKAVIDPTASTLERQYKSEMKKPTVASLDFVEVAYTSLDSTAIKVKVASEFAFNTDRGNCNFNYAFVVIENGVQGTGKNYEQTNYYAGGKNGKMGGFENLPNPVPASKMVYPEVARAIFDSFNGIENSVPETIVKGEKYTYEYTFDVPANVMKKKNMEVIALLLDNSTGEIWNAAKVSLDPTAIKTVEENPLDLRVAVAGGELVVQTGAECSSSITIELYGLDGKKVDAYRFADNAGDYRIPVGNLYGTYLVRVQDDNHSVVKKVILR